MITKLHEACIALCFCLWAATGHAETQPTVADGTGRAADNPYGSYDESLAGRLGDMGETWYIGMRLGVNAPTLFFRGVHGIPTNTLCGMNIGLVYGLQLTDSSPLFLETGLSYTEKGVKITATEATQKITHKMRYLEIPFVFKYRIAPGFDDLFIEPFFGGFFACGAGGQSKYYTDREKHDPFQPRMFRRPDAGFRMGCGVAYRNFYFEMSYDAGLVNIAGKRYEDFGFDDFDDKVRTGCFSATVGLNF